MATTYLTPGVYVEEVDKGSKPIEGVGTAVAAFLGVAARGPVGVPVMIANWTQFTETFGDFVPGAYLAHSVYGYFNNGGGLCYVVRIGGDGEAGASAPVPQAAIAGRAGGAPATLRAIARSADAGGVTVEIAESADDTFDVTIRRGSSEEKFDGLTMARGARNVFEVVNKQSTLVTLEEVKVSGLSLAERAPAPGTYPLALPETRAVAAARLSPDVYQGNAADRTGMGGLEAVEQITMLCAPDLMAAYQQGALDRDGVKAIQLAMIAHCERMGDRVAVIDPLPDMNAQQALNWRMNEAGYDSKYAALYYPWIQVANPTPGAASPTILVPPSGHMAGIWARSDGERGVHKAPANEVIRGVIGLPINITSSEQGQLNPAGINCIRSFPGRGIRVWGARTLSSDPAWRYLNVRRLFNYVEKSLENGTQWVVFEPNDYALWQRVKRDVSAFLKRVWMDGALFGQTPEEAFFVKCDAENNPPETRDVGQLIIDVGIAPVKPAEFVIFRISQFTPGAE
ncbi:MAG: phage tail sheath subtilisin-like domain-containing protein [Dehalococcoidia bacterium]|nr:phage tail sheath subtilisin-like domain-containing protein [Dehalococcoidia bacterium]RIL03319.1 MAG: phage tail protein [bacterium]